MTALDTLILLLLLALVGVLTFGFFRREYLLKQPCYYHHWEWDEKARSHRCSECKHLSGGGDDLKSWFSNGHF